METYTNGLFPATKHRVVIPPEEIRRKSPRQSFVFFVHPDDQVVAKPIKGQDPKKEKYATGVTARQHVLNQFASTYK